MIFLIFISYMRYIKQECSLNESILVKMVTVEVDETHKLIKSPFYFINEDSPHSFKMYQEMSDFQGFNFSRV